MKKLVCKVRGHQFVSIKKGEHRLKEYQCRYCKQKYTEDGYGQIVRLTRYWEMINLLFERYYHNKTAI